jgi:leukotriene-A4 hydrolase
MKLVSAAFAATLMALKAHDILLSVEAVAGTLGSTQDPSSYGNYDQFQALHFELDYSLHFDDETTRGTITHTLKVLESVMDVYFDIWDAVEVSKAEFRGPNSTDFVEVKYNITTPNPNIGNALAVALPVEMNVDELFYIRFTFVTLPDTTALDWLKPEMTYGKTMPFVYR